MKFLKRALHRLHCLLHLNIRGISVIVILPLRRHVGIHETHTHDLVKIGEHLELLKNLVGFQNLASSWIRLILDSVLHSAWEICIRITVIFPIYCSSSLYLSEGFLSSVCIVRIPRLSSDKYKIKIMLLRLLPWLRTRF